METVIGKTTDFVVKTENKIYQILILILSILKDNLAGFLKFLFERNIVQTGIGIIMATQVSKITNLLVETIINPIINRITFGTIKNVNEWEIKIFDITLKIGVIISAIINFMSVAFVVYYIWKFSQNSNFSFITGILDQAKVSIDKARPKVFINVNSPTTAYATAA